MKSDPFAKTEDGSLGHLLVEGAEREELVVEALQECQAAIDAGKTIDREAMLAKYPVIREELSACLEGLALMRPSNSGGAGHDIQAAQTHLSPAATLGDFRIQRELGRGGMGVVYEAEQLSVGRLVALKVLPYAAMLDKRQVTRFQNEARAAATLEHPHIVPVYFVGNERGVHYYAMRLIDGKNLAEVMSELRSAEPSSASGSPTSISQITLQLTEVRRSTAPRGHAEDAPKAETVRDVASETVSEIVTAHGTRGKVYYQSIARLGKQAAEALEFAHSHGIIHRDIKPANVMLDDIGDAWITDFGLARIEADAGMTMTGDLVGTLRYMSPEQALVKRITVDHRSDVYSLGATLYEMLTLYPLFAGDDRAALLRQIAHTEPKPPSSIVRSIPKDLETIILKAIRKAPEDRYETAQDLADDLARFLSYEPVLARRTPIRQRLRMWTRRHPAILAAATFVFAVSLLSVAMIGLLVAKYEHDGRAHEKSARAEIESALQARSAALERVKSTLKVSHEQKKRADAAANEANNLRSVAEERAESLRQQLYVQEMRQAYDAWKHGWTDQVVDLLENQKPIETQRDCRGFEWYVLHALTWRPPPIELVGHEGAVHGLAVFDDGTRLASVGEDATVRIWNLETYQEEFSLRDSRESVQLIGDLGSMLTDSLNGGKVSVSNNDNELRALAISPDGTKLATGNLMLSLWDLETQSRIRDLAVFPTRIFGVAFSPDGRYVAAHSSDEGVKTVGVNGQLVKTEHTGAGSYRLSFSPDGSRLAAPFHHRAVKSKGIRCWNMDNWDDSMDYPLDHSVRGCVFSRDGQFLFCGGYEGDAFALNLESGAIQLRIPQQRSRPNDIDIAEDERAMAVAYQDGTVAFTPLRPNWQHSEETALLTPQLIPVHDGSANAVRFIGQNRIVTSGNDGIIRITQVNSSAIKHSIVGEEMYNRCLFRPHSDELIVVTLHGIRRYDSTSKEMLGEVDFWNPADANPLERRSISLACTRAGNIVGIGNNAGSIAIYDLHQNQVTHRIDQTDIRASAIGDIAFSPNGQWMANGSRDHTIRIRSTLDWREVHRVETQGWEPMSSFLLTDGCWPTRTVMEIWCC